MEFFGKHRLVVHPGTPARGVDSVDVEIARSGRSVLMRYSVRSASTLLLPAHGRERRDNLWQETCFELFVRPDSRGYVEFNFAPLSAWNAYSFADWRMGRRPYQPEVEPIIRDCRADGRADMFPASYALDVQLSDDVMSFAPGSVSLAAILHEEDGTVSYWALSHSPGDPNFHHPDCFVARLA